MSSDAYQSNWELFCQGRRATAISFVVVSVFAIASFLAFDAILAQDVWQYEFELEFRNDWVRPAALLSFCAISLLIQVTTIYAILRALKSKKLPRNRALASLAIMLVSLIFAAIALDELTKPEPTPIRIV